MKTLKSYLFVAILLSGFFVNAQVITNGLVGYYPLDGDANDASGNGIHGTVYGAIPVSDLAGNANGAYAFDGANDYIQIPANSLLNMSNNFTISAWIKLSSTAPTSGMGIVKWGENLPGQRRCLMVWGGGTSVNRVYWSGAFSGANIQGSDVSPDTWYHVAVSVTSSNLASVYVNGVLQNSGTVTLNSYPFSGVKIGATMSQNIDEHFDGTIDEVGIYNRVLSSSEINTIYNTPPTAGGQLCSSIFCVNNNVGIGVTNPTAKLDVQGTGRFTDAVELANNKSLKWAGSGASIRNEGSYMKYLADNRHYFDVNGTRHIAITSSGRLGIGTTTPDEKLEVKGNILLDTYENNVIERGIFFRKGFNVSNRYNLSIFSYDHNAGGVTPDGLSINAYDGISFSTGSNSRNEVMRIHQNGNVGIGILNPTTALDVDGIIRSGDNSATTGGMFMAQNYSGTNYLGSLSSNYSSGSLILGYGAAGKEGSGSTTLVSTYDNFTGYKSAARIGPGTFEFLASPSASLVTKGNDLTMESRFYIGQSGTVGIGTANPNTVAKLDVRGVAILNDDSDYQLRLESPDNWAGIRFKDSNSQSHIFYHGQNETFGIGVGANMAGKKLHIHGGTSIGANYVDAPVAADGLVVEGNVGVGVSAPINKLHVFDDRSGYAPVVVENSNATGLGLLVKAGNGSTYVADFRKADNTNLVRISGDGKVGIGTTTPSAKLSMRENNQGLNVLLNKKVDGSWPPIAEDKTVTFQSTGAASGDIAFASGNSELARITKAGRLGIGTSSPTVALDIVGSVKTTGNTVTNAVYVGGEESLKKNSGFLYLGTGNFTSGIFTNKRIRTTEDIQPYSDLGSDLGTTSARWSAIYGQNLDLTGNINVGATSVPAGYKLAVGGKIITEEVKVKLQSAGWPDYVFANDYQLPTLKEVEKHIQEKGYLPSIPSAEEVGKNGIFVGEMNAKLLQKIEELTLYTIDQEKELDQQKKELTQQDNRIEKLEEENKKLKELLVRVAKLESELKKKK